MHLVEGFLHLVDGDALRDEGVKIQVALLVVRHEHGEIAGGQAVAVPGGLERAAAAEDVQQGQLEFHLGGGDAHQDHAAGEVPGVEGLFVGFGAADGIDSSKEDPVEAIRALTGGNGADVVIDAVGRPETYKQAFYARDLAGRVVLVGVPTPEMKLELPLLDVFGRGGSLKSSWYGDCLPSRDFPMLVAHYKQGNLDLDAFVSERITIDQVEEAFDKMHEGKVLRSVVEL